MTPPDGETQVAVAVCDSLADPPGRPRLAALCASLEASLPGVRAAVVPGLSGDARRGPALAARTGAARLVLAVGEDGASSEDVQRQARRAGVDPFAVEILRLAPGSVADGTASALGLRLTATVARLRAFDGTAPEQLRPRLLTERTALSRRSLLILPPLTYEGVAGVARRRCLDAQRCRLCVEACPRGALAVDGGRIVVDTMRCDGCGLCASTCPRRAVGPPGSSPAQYEAQIETLLGAREPALLFCRREAPIVLEAAAAGWLPVEVPCVGMVSPGWALQALAGGARTLALVRCDHDCGFRGEVLDERVSYLRALLTLLGDARAAERVQVVGPGRDELRAPRPLPALRPAGEPRRPLRLDEPAATAGALLELRRIRNRPLRRPLAHAASPLGLLRMRDGLCTLCGTCAGACPTGALRLDTGDDGMALSYDAADCIGCGRCVAACPEARTRPIAVERVTDLEALARGRTALESDPLVRCRDCGRPIAPRPLLGRIGELLGGEQEAGPLLRIVGERCADCRVNLQPVAQGGQ